MAEDQSRPMYPLYNSTYTAYRVSPLYHGEDAILDEAHLATHARTFSQTLRGDSVRGIPIAYDEYNHFDRCGALQLCSWDLLGDEATWNRMHTSKEGEDNDISTASVLRVEPETLRGVHIQLQYERAAHSALLLRDPEIDEFAVDGFTSLPLLLIRMPAPLRELMVDYLSKTFDCRVTPLRLHSSFLTSSLESLLRRLDNKSGSETLTALSKGVQLQLRFPPLSAMLKNLDITVAREDIPGFMAHGRLLQPASTLSPKQPEPFTLALQHYLSTHLALSMAHPDVCVSKVVVGPFALSSDGKLKLFAPSEPAEDEESSPTQLAMRDFYTALCTYSAGVKASLPSAAKAQAMRLALVGAQDREKRPLVEVDRNVSRSSPSKKRAKSAEMADDEIVMVNVHSSPRKRAQMGVPVEPPPPYELVDPRLIA